MEPPYRLPVATIDMAVWDPLKEVREIMYDWVEKKLFIINWCGLIHGWDFYCYYIAYSQVMAGINIVMPGYERYIVL